MRQKKLIGHATDRWTIELDRSDIRRLAGALGSTNPLHFDEAAAKKAGYSDLVAPTALAATLGQSSELIKLLEVHPKNVLLSEHTVQLKRPLCAGDTLRVNSVILNVSELPIGNGTTGFVTIEDRGTDVKGKQVFLARRVLAIRGGFPRR